MVHINVITGFLGAGKTTFIKHLLSQKPEAERWGVLVNEFGEVGIDGALLASNNSQIAIKEVPGGCLCCANGLPFQIALNQLIGAQHLDRLLIEPTGLGHPIEILTLLAQPCYQDLSQLDATLALVDARKLGDSRYTEHVLFNQQLMVADHILAAKADTYEACELPTLNQYLQSLRSESPFQLSVLEAGIGQPAWLEAPALAWLKCSSVASAKAPANTSITTPLLALAPSYNSQGFVFKYRYADGFHAYGWAFSPELTFSTAALEHCFLGLNCERLKAVIITEDCVLGFNLADGVMSMAELDDCLDSRVELLCRDVLDTQPLLSQLLAALVIS